MDAPVACSLTPDQYRARAHDLAALAARALRSRERTADGERLIFDDTGQTERELRAAIAAEAVCCPWMRMDLQRREQGLVVDVAGPHGARSVIAELFV